MLNISEKIENICWGQIFGDMCGAPIEGCLPNTLKLKYRNFNEYLRNFENLYYTDDSQYALILIESLRHKGELDPEYIVKLFLKHLRILKTNSTGALRGTGQGARAAFNNMKIGKKFWECGTVSAGNGVGMRISPIPCWFFDDKDKMEHAIIQSSLITHLDPRAIAGGSAIAAAIHYGLTIGSENFFQKDAIIYILKTVNSVEDKLFKEYQEFFPPKVDKFWKQTSICLERQFKYYEEPLPDLLENILKIAKEYTSYRIFPTHAFVFCSVHLSVILAIKWFNVSFNELLWRVYNLGGDTDTIGAMVGAISASSKETKELPLSWKKLIPSYKVTEQRIKDFASRTVISPEKDTLEPLALVEAKITQKMFSTI